MKDQLNNPDIICLATMMQDKENVLQYIIQKIEKGTGESFKELKSKHAEDKLFFLGLKYVTTTKKAFCEATGIPVEAGCRYKRKLEKAGQLVQSADEVVCPYTRHTAHLISTNPAEFDRLGKTNSKQLNLWES